MPLLSSVYGRLAAVAGLGLLLAAVGWVASRDVIATRPTGPANACQAIPAFVKPFELAQPYFDTSRRDRPGLVLADAGKPDTIIQKPNWRQFGSLGPLANGEGGVTYTASVPVINTLSSDEQSHLAVLRLDAATGDLELWTRLEGEPLSGQNYYGITALTYDCTNRLLYAAAVAGSSREAQKGFIAAIDTTTGHERFRYEGIDVLGLGMYGGSSGRYLYAGLARSADIVRIKVNGEGKPFGGVEQVVQFDEFNRTRARKLEFQGQRLTVDTTEFYYNLIASTEFDQKRLVYQYDGRSDSFAISKSE